MQDLTVTSVDQQIIDEIYSSLNTAVKSISSRFFYDDIGSELFEQITHLPAYYPPKTEKALLKRYSKQILEHSGSADLIELGSGDCSKISIFLDAITRHKLQHYTYYPVDISKAALQKSADILKQSYPALIVKPIVADFMKHINSLPGTPGNRLLLFFGSTIGNLTRQQALSFMSKIESLMASGDYFLVGFDRVKNSEVLEDAYNDSQGVTAAFNKNILNVINRYTQSNFNTSDFDHYAFYNAAKQRIEMHLKARKALHITSTYFDQPISFEKGETIHTENSHKFTTEHIKALADNTGLKISEIYSDKAQWFSLALFQK